MIKAKTILNNRFWVVEKDGIRIGTITINDDKYMFSGNNGVRFFKNKKHIEKNFGTRMFELNKPVHKSTEKVIYGYPTKTIPYNTMYDVKKKIAIYSKSKSSKTFYSAGYYIIRFEKNWAKSFCPKIDTLERYEHKGPFKTEQEMREALRNVNTKN